MQLRLVYPTWQEAVRQISIAFNKRNQGGSVTLTNSSTTTTVSHGEAKATSLVFLQATDANSAGESPYISTKSTGSFVITHANATTTRTFDYLIINKA